MATQRIDVHHHVLPEFYKDVQRAAGITGSAYQSFPVWSPESSLALMDANRFGAAIFSFTSPGIFFGDVAQTRDLARRFNDWLAELVASRPDRFGAFAFLPLPDVDASLREIARIYDELKLDGVCLLTSVDERYIGHPDFWPVYEELNRRKAVVFIHPCYPPGTEARGWDIPRMLIDYPFETTRVATNLIFNGVTEKLPDIKFILSHAGGTLPMLAHRISSFEKLQPWSAAFVAPVANSLQYLMTFTGARVDFGVAFVGGVLIGAFVSSLASGRAQLVSFESPRQTLRYLAGGLLMGFGGVLALGCSTGQGLSGVSTLAPASFVALASIASGMWAGLVWDRVGARAGAAGGVAATA